MPAIGGLPLPRVGPRMPDPRAFMDKIVGPARRFMAARFFSGGAEIREGGGVSTVLARERVRDPLLLRVAEALAEPKLRARRPEVAVDLRARYA